MKLVEERQIKVFNKEGKYSIGISNKKQDGTYDNAYIPIQFNKGVELENGTDIYIKNAWLSFYKWEYDGKKGTTFIIKCNDFSKVDEVIESSHFEDVKEDPFKEFGEDNINLELPF